MVPSKGVFNRTTIIVAAALFLSVTASYLAFGSGVYHWKEYTHHYEAGAVSDLIALHTMQENYKKGHRSYASAFSQLGIPLGARLNSGLLTWNEGYSYRMIDIVEDQYGFVVEYSIDARPSKYSHESNTSFLMDHRGMIHFTSVNRAATEKDPSIPNGK